MPRPYEIALAILVSVAACASSPALAQMPPQEQISIRALPPASPHWIAVMAFGGSITVSPILLVDGDSMQVIGTISGGVTSMFAAAPDHKQLYTADRYYSRGTRGDRLDVVTIYDTSRLAPIGEITIPSKRQLAVQDPTAMAVTPDGRFLLVANMTPATSVTAVDLQSRKVAGEIPIPGCSEVLVVGARDFVSVCGDGSMLATRFDDQAKVAAQKRTAEPFFNVEKDPVFDLPAMFGKEAVFVSYRGTVYPMDLSASPPRPGETWSVLTDSQKRDGWRPGGWQPVSGHARNHLLFVLMHRGGEWSQKEAGSEVWVYDIRDHKRVERIPLPQKANSIRISQDDNPLMFTASTRESVVQIFSGLGGKYLGGLKEMGNPNSLFGL
jgi:methylamine dehydrogenase heavy chain